MAFSCPMVSNRSLNNNFIYDHRLIIPDLKSLFIAENAVKANIIFSMDKDSFCSFMKSNGYHLDRTTMDSETTSLQFREKEFTVLFQHVVQEKRRVYCIMQIYYNQGVISSITYDRDGSVYEVTYRGDENFRILKRTIFREISHNKVINHLKIHNSLKLNCYLYNVVTVNGVITEAIYFLNNNCYDVNKLNKLIGRNEIVISDVEDYLDVANLFNQDDALLLQMALC